MLVVRFKMQAQPGKADQLMSYLRDVALPSRSLDGVISFDIGRDVTDPDAFIATEVFEDRAALDRQESLGEVAAAMEFFESALAGDPEATIYHVSSAEPYGE